MLLKVERFLADAVLKGSDLIRVDSEIAEADILFRAGRFKETTSLYQSTKASLEILLQRVELEEVRQRARALAEAATAEYARNGIANLRTAVDQLWLFDLPTTLVEGSDEDSFRALPSRPTAGGSRDGRGHAPHNNYANYAATDPRSRAFLA